MGGWGCGRVWVYGVPYESTHVHACVTGLPFFNLCAPIALLRPSGLSYAPSMTCLHAELAPLLMNASDGCWGHDVKRVTESPAGAACTVMT